MIKYLLDTNILIYVMRNRLHQVCEIFNRNSERMAISVISFAELIGGAEKSAKPSENLSEVEDFCSRLVVLDYGVAQAAHYGQIRAELEKSGRIIGVNDMHIAAHARSLGLICVTNNEKEFRRVSGLQIENWVLEVRH